MSIILKKRKKNCFFKFLKIKLSAKGLLQPLLFAEAVGCRVSSVGRRGGVRFPGNLPPVVRERSW